MLIFHSEVICCLPVHLSAIAFHVLPLSSSQDFLFISHLSPYFLSSLITLPVLFPNDSVPVSLCLLRRSGRLGCFPVERRVPAVYLSISLVNISNNSINNTWAVINKLHKHPRRTSSLGLVLADLVGDKEMMERLWRVAELSVNSCGCVLRRSERWDVQAICDFIGKLFNLRSESV